MTDSEGRITNPIWIRIIPEDSNLIPKYQTAGSAGCDLMSNENLTLPVGGRKTVGTGIKLEIPDGFGAYVCPRSGLAAKRGITVLNSPGVIDTDYRGEIKVVLYNAGEEDFIIEKGDRIAQLVFFPIFQAIFQKAKEVTSTLRGDGGFGSTGT